MVDKRHWGVTASKLEVLRSCSCVAPSEPCDSSGPGFLTWEMLVQGRLWWRRENDGGFILQQEVGAALKGFPAKSTGALSPSPTSHPLLLHALAPPSLFPGGSWEGLVWAGRCQCFCAAQGGCSQGGLCPFGRMEGSLTVSTRGSELRRRSHRRNFQRLETKRSREVVSC